MTSNLLTDIHLELRQGTPDGSERERILNHDLVDIATLGDIFLICISPNETREWYFPNGTVVSSNSGSMRPDIYANKSSTGTLLHLNRRRNAMSPIGIYRCEVLESSGITISLYVGIYTSTGGIIFSMAA